MKTVNAFLVRKDKDDKEEVDLVVNGIKLTCFVAVCPKTIHVGNYYQVTLELYMPNEYEVTEATSDRDGFEKTGDTFEYLITGTMKGSIIDCGIEFEDLHLLSHYGYLDGKRITIRVYRIDVGFDVHD